jgi:serine/threonine protein phosphatase PrpC
MPFFGSKKGKKEKRSKSPMKPPPSKREQTPPKKATPKKATPKKGKSGPAPAPAPAPAAAEEAFIGSLPEGSPLSKAQIADRVVSSREPQTVFELGRNGNGDVISMRYAYVSQRGYYPEDLYKANQDAFKISTKFAQDDVPQILLGVFDGHGGEGDRCAAFVRDRIEAELAAQIKKQPRGKNFEKAYSGAFSTIGKKIHDQEDFDDTMSGTTAITAFFRGTQVDIANIGDSRAIVGRRRRDDKIYAHPLSMDQTPYRKDERERVKKAGAEVMSVDMLNGEVPFHENWGVNLGEQTDDSGDPPRVWVKGQQYPGCAFTRSIGDAVAEDIGVTPVPELSAIQLTERDEVRLCDLACHLPVYLVALWPLRVPQH